MDQCSFCKRIFEPSEFEQFSGDMSPESLVLPVYDADQVYALIQIQGNEAFVSEECYRSRQWDFLAASELAELYYQMGLDFFGHERFADAIESFRHAMNIDRKSDVLGSLASALEITGQFSEAIDLLEEIRTRDPDHDALVRNLPRLYNLVQRFSDALHETERTAESRHFNFHCLMDRAEALLALHRKDDATTVASEARRFARGCCSDHGDELDQQRTAIQAKYRD